MFDKLTFVNEACALIGADPIDTLDEDTPSAQAVALCYDSRLRWAMGLRMGGWTFGKATRQLTLRANVTPLSGYTKVYAMPAMPTLRIGPPFKVAPSADWPRQKFTDYVIEANDVHCDCAALYGLFPIMPEPSAFSPAFAGAFKTLIAADMYMALASDKDGRDRLLNEAVGAPREGGIGGLMGMAIQLDRAAEPSQSPLDGGDRLTSAWSFP